ncbi:hypothetical protein IWQ60_011970 [Tieghemiomyces parasiticus]|uniref:Uncharacterized protein n=1 Tax=Tieghemiomyces parasiticus TaxID=78921 RepID=A0A9W7ZM79_9FUNG|nr:hypothetical protein IWQ60_011970 [Tieghemiomyces parasiticus]
MTMLAEAEPVKPAEEQKIREWTHNTQLLARKATEYQTRLDDLVNEYAKRRIEARGLDYPTLQASDTRIRELSDQLRDAMRRLESYQALPPDITLATIKLDEANSALAALEKQREELLCQLAEQLG